MLKLQHQLKKDLLLRNESFDAIISDYDMPDMDGMNY